MKHPCRQWCQVDYNLKIESARSKAKSKIASESLVSVSSSSSLRQSLSYLQLEHLKCPIHVAIENGHLRVVTLMVRRDPQIIEHADGYGTTPLRLALRNRHVDETKRRNQRDVARFIMGQQFDTKVTVVASSSTSNTDLSSGATAATAVSQATTTVTQSITVSLRIRYKMKCWSDRARDRVLIVHGLAKSSLPKKKILLRTGLVGNKVDFIYIYYSHLISLL